MAIYVLQYVISRGSLRIGVGLATCPIMLLKMLHVNQEGTHDECGLDILASSEKTSVEVPSF